MAEVKMPPRDVSEEPKSSDISEALKSRGVTSGKVHVEKESVAKSLASDFIHKDLPDIAKYVKNDVFVPKLKELGYGVVEGMTSVMRDSLNEMAAKIFGHQTDATSVMASRMSTRPVTNYSGYYARPQVPARDVRVLNERQEAYSADRIVYEGPTGRQDAIDVLTQMKEQIKSLTVYDTEGRVMSPGFVSILDYKEFSQNPEDPNGAIKFKSTDDNWGWHDLSTATVTRSAYGWVINLPRVEAR